MTVTVLAPAYNEEAVIADFVRTISGHLGPEYELLVVDDGSDDDTAQILQELETEVAALRIITHPKNRGLGAALATGFRAAQGSVIVTMDADLSHPLELLPELVEGCSRADAVFASRYVPGGGMEGVPWHRAWISRVANWILRLAFWCPIRDLTTGYRAYQTSVVRDLNLVGTRFETQLEITLRLVAQSRTIHEVPLMLSTRAAGESKMRYLRLIPRYGMMMLRMLKVRWLDQS